LAEQRQVVSEIERLLSITDATERMIEESLKQAERLRQSILKRAFEGKLVPQDPADEPAEVLLERIREERERKQDTRQKLSRAPRKAKREAQMKMLD
jgi:type I restriction enzyme, S subunit